MLPIAPSKPITTYNSATTNPPMNWLLDPAPVIRFFSNADSTLVAPTLPSSTGRYLWTDFQIKPVRDAMANVRFTPESGHLSVRLACPLRANSRQADTFPFECRGRHDSAN